MYEEVDNRSLDDVIDRIIALNAGLREFWTSAHGWAPVNAAHLLSKSRLDWQVSLSKTLKIWHSDYPSDEKEGRLILAWPNLGSLVEGTLKLFLSVYYDTYKDDLNAVKDRNGELIDPDTLTLEKLKVFFKKSVWREDSKWDKECEDLIEKIQLRRNAIHAYRNRDIGTFDEFYESVRTYLKFLRIINSRLPYPDRETYQPREE